MQCHRCNKRLDTVHKKHIIQLNSKIIILENTPFFQCANCCEEFVENKVSKIIEKIEDQIEKTNIRIAIMDYRDF